MPKKTVTQQLKDEFKENYRFHQQSMDITRKAQSLIREIEAIGAPRLDLEFVFTCLFTIPRLGIAYAWRDKDSLGSHGFVMAILTSFSKAYWLALQHVAEWAGFRIGMLFRCLFDELKNILRSATYGMMTGIAALLGVWLVLTVIFYVLSH